MDQSFYEAWFNADHKVLGRRLHPFCLNDALVLSLAESPFMLGKEPGVRYDLPALQLAVQVCSTPADVFLQARFDRSWPQKLTTFGWTLWCRRQDFHTSCQQFLTYIDDYYAVPEVWQNESDSPGDKLHAPWILGNAVFLMRNTTLSSDEIWTMPIGKALWITATLSEQLGAPIQIVSEEEQAGMAALGL